MAYCCLSYMLALIPLRKDEKALFCVTEIRGEIFPEYDGAEVPRLHAHPGLWQQLKARVRPHLGAGTSLSRFSARELRIFV